RRVHVRDLDHLALGRVGAHLLDCGELDAHDGRHRAGADWYRLLHELAALAHDADRVGEAECARDDQGGVLTEAVAGGQRGLETALSARGGRRYRGGQDRGLGVGRQRQVGLGPLEHQPSEVEAERVVGFLKDRLGAGRALVETLAHADRLRALTGKEKRDGHWSGCLEASLDRGWPETEARGSDTPDLTLSIRAGMFSPAHQDGAPG